tara:strand:- start:22566 stop:22766 length:201 start_codon:yes stop_codon:yes gene_type:complete
MWSDIDCPHCNKGNEINHDDGYGYGEDDIYNQRCSSCGERFHYKTIISFYYEAVDELGNEIEATNG